MTRLTPRRKRASFQELASSKREQTHPGREDQPYLQESRWYWSDHGWPPSTWPPELTALFLHVPPSLLPIKSLAPWLAVMGDLVSQQQYPLTPFPCGCQHPKYTFLSTNLSSLMASETRAEGPRFQVHKKHLLIRGMLPSSSAWDQKLAWVSCKLLFMLNPNAFMQSLTAQPWLCYCLQHDSSVSNIHILGTHCSCNSADGTLVNTPEWTHCSVSLRAPHCLSRQCLNKHMHTHTRNSRRACCLNKKEC